MWTHDKVLLSCAVTGAIHVPTMSPHLPVTPEEIADEAIAAADTGASIVHVHVRHPETGEPVTDLELFREVAERIRAETDVVVQPMTGGAPTMAPEERISIVPEPEPAMASCNMGSINFYLRRGELAESNADLVAKIRDLTYEVAGRDLATPDEAREFLGLKDAAEVAF